jgi:hypothetical protein
MFEDLLQSDTSGSEKMDPSKLASVEWQAFWLIVEAVFNISRLSTGVKTLYNNVPLRTGETKPAPPMPPRDIASTPAKQRHRRNALPMIFLPDVNRISGTTESEIAAHRKSKMLTTSSLARPDSNLMGLKRQASNMGMLSRQASAMGLLAKKASGLTMSKSFRQSAESLRDDAETKDEDDELAVDITHNISAMKATKKTSRRVSPEFAAAGIYILHGTVQHSISDPGVVLYSSPLHCVAWVLIGLRLKMGPMRLYTAPHAPRAV